MPRKNVAQTVTYIAWDTSANAGKTGDAANHTIRAVGDGTEFTPAASPAEVDATNLKGVYKIALAAGEMNYNCITLGGISSTANIVIFPVEIFTDQGGVLADPTQSFMLATGTASAGSVNTITLAGAVATDHYYEGAVVKIVSGTGAGQAPRQITSYLASRVATVNPNFAVAPDNTSVFAVLAVPGVATAMSNNAPATTKIRVRIPFATGHTLAYSIERLADGLLYDFATTGGTPQQFTALGTPPTTLTRSLPEGSGIFAASYSDTYTTTGLLAQFTDGDYMITVHDTVANAVVARYVDTLHGGDDGPVFPSGWGFDPLANFVPASYASGTAGSVLARVGAQTASGGGSGGSDSMAARNLEIPLGNILRPLSFTLTLSSSGDPGVSLTPTVVLSKNGGAFAAPAGAVSEVGNGTYQVAANATDANTRGKLELYATAPGCLPARVAFYVYG